MAQKKNHPKKRTPAYSTDTMVVCMIVGLLLVALGVMIFLSTALNMSGDVFDGLRQFSRGMCGMLAIVLPVIPIWGGVLIMMSTQKKPPIRPFVLACVLMVLLCTAVTLLLKAASDKTLMAFYQERVPTRTMGAYLSIAFRYGSTGNGYGGGLIGMLLAWPLWKSVGVVGGSIITILGGIVTFLFLIRLDVRGIAARAQQRRADRQARLAAEQEAQRQQELRWQQEQMRIRQEQARMQEAARQQQIQQQLAQQQLQQAQRPTYAAYPQQEEQQPMPVVKQVQPRRGAAKPAQQHGFQPTPEELGEYATPQPMPEPRKKRGGIFNRDKSEAAVADPYRTGRSTQPTPAAEPFQPADDVAPEEAAPVRRSAYQRPEPQPAPMAEAPVFPSEEPAYDAPPAKPVRRSAAASAARTETVTQAAPAASTAPATPSAPEQKPSRAAAAVPAAPARKPVAPPEELDEDFSAEVKEKPVNENSFLARLRAAKKAAGIEVPEESATPKPAPAFASNSWKEESAPPRPIPRSAKPAKSAEEVWAETPPWEEVPGAAAEPEVPLRPVVTAKKPEGSYEPDLKLKPRRGGSDVPAGPMFDEHVDIPYAFPPMNLLKPPAPQQGISPEEDAMLSRRLENTLQSFRVPAKVRHITHGPAISRFELELAAGIKVSKVTDLNRNIAMNMEVKSVRIEAPIPGKSLVGVEVPNKQRATVTLLELMESEPMRKATKPLIVALGKDIAGTPIICDLAKMPHLLIAGATGSGKSVCINTIINSLLYRCSPKDVRLILVDPKVVELQCYNGIPHLLIPVVSDPHKASGALAWAVGEMMDRYKRFQEAGVRAIDGYNEQVGEDGEKMPRIVIVIDELADLMMTCKKDVEERICRLAQLARAAGIHLIVATQRPSVDVITGLIKANIPSRIAFKVSSNVDSRTILDRIGAEQLLGYGDMLYAPTGEFTPIRVQGCFLSDKEVNDITDFIRENNPADYDPAVLEELERLQAESDQNSGSSLPEIPSGDDYASGDGSLLLQCIEMAVQDGQVSTSLIQRRLRLGYARAGRLVDEMESRGIVGPKDGAKPRMCLISREEFEAMKATGELE